MQNEINQGKLRFRGALLFHKVMFKLVTYNETLANRSFRLIQNS